MEIIKSGNQASTADALKLVVTDLDGTLLDHHSYSYAPALPALRRLALQNIPVIFCSSKTRTEIERLRSEMGSNQPFIVENGAAICAGAGEGSEAGTFTLDGDLVLGRPHTEILHVLNILRQEYGFRYQGFSDMTIAEVAACTGLDEQQAEHAARREYSEPLVWQDTDLNRERFLALLDRHGLAAQQGGRFLTVAGLTDKGKAVRILRELYAKQCGQPVKVIALGDSPNDQPMLEVADIAVVIHSDKSGQIQLSKPTTIIHTEERGPAGWNRAITDLLEE